METEKHREVPNADPDVSLCGVVIVTSMMTREFKSDEIGKNE